MRVRVTIEIDVADKFVADDYVSGLNYITPYMGDNAEVSWVEVEDVFDYSPTHASVRDSSQAMLVRQDDKTITLVNEEGYEWTDPANRWRQL